MKWAIILLIGTLIFAERGTTKQVQSILQLLQELKDKEYRYLELSVIIEDNPNARVLRTLKDEV
ncbi:MAG: hypothetical protein ACHQXG_10075 [Nitrososphaerales archaeon]